MKTGLFFGSFNPIHNGHLKIADFMLQNSDLDQVWFVISPHNPFKEEASLLPFEIRLHLVQCAVNEYSGFSACDIESRLPKPSYTIDTMNALEKEYPRYTFSIIMGADGLRDFHKWKQPEALIKRFERYVYPRPNVLQDEYSKHSNIKVFDAPMMEISSSDIRQNIKEGTDVEKLLPQSVFNEIMKRGYYK